MLRDQGRGRTIVLIAGVVLLLAGPASGANLTDVRVGVHADYSRVVFQLDGISPYQLVGMQPKEDGSQVLIVALDAAPSEIAPIRPAKSRHIRAVRVRAGESGKTDVRIRLSGDAEMKELVLRGPDRIVLDFFDPGAGKASLVSSLTASPAPAAEPLRESGELAAVAEPLAPADEGAVEAADELAPSDAAVEELAMAGDDLVDPADDAAMDEALAEAELAALDEPLLEGEVLGDAPEGLEPEPGSDDAFAGVEIGEVVSEEPLADAPVATPPLEPPAAQGSGSLLGSPVVLTALAGLAVVALLFVLGRRRRGSADADEGEVLSPLDVAEDAEPEAGFAFSEGLEGEGAAGARDEGLPPASQYDIEPGAVHEGAPAEEAVVEGTDDPEEDFPAPAGIGGAPAVPVAPVAPMAAVGPNEVGNAEVGKIVEEFERRIAHLETRLEEVVDAKERLERQASAQTEELRVQRAAIARTQRVLRTIARPEDEPSEPAPKL